MSGISGFFERNGCRLCTRIVADANAVALSMDFGVKFREMTGYELSNSSHLATILCTKCDKEFNELYNYRKSLIASQMHLNRLIIPDVKIKMENLTFSHEHVDVSDLRMFDEINIGGDMLHDEMVELQPQIAVNIKVEAYTEDDNFNCVNFVESPYEIAKINPSPAKPPRKRARKTVKKKPKKETPKSKPAVVIKTEKTTETLTKLETLQSDFICDYCGEKFNAKFTLYLHMIIHDKLPEAVTLKYRRSDRRRVLIDPPQMKFKKPRKIGFQCDYCGKKLSRKTGLYQHMIVHKKLPEEVMKLHRKKLRTPRPVQVKKKIEKKSKYEECKICHKVFQRKYMKLHTQRSHNRIIHACDHCDKVDWDKQSLLQHIKRIHFPHVIPKRTFTCDLCGEKLLTPSAFYYHKNTVHLVGDFKCKLCDHVSMNKNEERYHFESRHNRNRFCDICGHWFSSRDFFQHSRPKVHVFPFVCPVEGCLRAFMTETGLDAHKRFWHKNISEDDQICPICNRAFPTDHKLKRHITRTHKTEKIPCPVQGCKYSGKRREYLRCHLDRTHVNLELKHRDYLYTNFVMTVRGNFN